MAKRYSSLYDANYDDEKLLWLESVCNDPNCDYCKDRPLFPVLDEQDRVIESFVGDTTRKKKNV